VLTCVFSAAEHGSCVPLHSAKRCTDKESGGQLWPSEISITETSGVDGGTDAVGQIDAKPNFP
jgi:hypothetical protein